MEILNISDNSFVVLLKKSEMEENSLFTKEQTPCDREIVSYIKKLISDNPMLQKFGGEKSGLIINAFSKNEVFELFVSRMEESAKASRKAFSGRQSKGEKNRIPLYIYGFENIDTAITFVKRLYCCGMACDVWFAREGSKVYITPDRKCPFAGEYGCDEEDPSFYGYLTEHCILLKKGFAERLAKKLK